MSTFQSNYGTITYAKRSLGLLLSCLIAVSFFNHSANSEEIISTEEKKIGEMSVQVVRFIAFQFEKSVNRMQKMLDLHINALVTEISKQALITEHGKARNAEAIRVLTMLLDRLITLEEKQEKTKNQGFLNNTNLVAGPFTSTDITAIAIFISILSPIIGFYINSARQTRIGRVRATFELLNNTHSNTQHAEKLASLAPHIRSNAQINKEFLKHEQHQDALRYILNYYEQVSLGIRKKNLDENIALLSERGTIITLYKFAESYISQIRAARRRPSIYENLEWLAQRWAK